MNFDIRIPIGLLFAILGALLSSYGVLASPEIYRTHSLGLNINLAWGSVLLLFGVTTLAIAAFARGSQKAITTIE